MTDGAGTPPSRRRWLIVALTVSLAINLFLIGLFAGSMRHHHGPPPGPHERFEQIAADLGLNDAQKAAFGQFTTTLREQGGAMRRANMAAWTKIADPSTGPDQIAALLNGTVKNRTDFQQDVANSLGKFLTALTPEQRATFIEKAAHMSGHRHHGALPH
jgi:Spy/CpxP family protein refolding chaperone